ncbi:MAG: hypothetical protein WA399_11045, partial [Acidobacteriaceae bacterium]
MTNRIRPFLWTAACASLMPLLLSMPAVAQTDKPAAPAAPTPAAPTPGAAAQPVHLWVTGVD